MIILIILENILLALNRGSFLDPDLGWRLRLGQYMAETGHLPTNFIGYNYFQNLQFVDHQWLSNLLIYLAYDKWGYYSLFIASIIILSVTSILVYKLCYRRANSFVVSALITIFFLVAMSQIYVGFRLQYITYLGGAVILLIFDCIKDWRLRYGLYFLLFVLGSNLHGGGFLFFVPVTFLLESQGIFDPKERERSIAVYRLALLIVLLLVAMSVNPYGLNFWKTMLEYILDPYYKKNIAEWAPVISLPMNWVYLLQASFVIFIFGVEKNWKKIQVSKLLLYGLLAFSAFSSQRFFPLLIMFLAPEISLLMKGIKPVSKRTSYCVIGGLLTAIIIFQYVFVDGSVFQLPKRDIFTHSPGYPSNNVVEFLRSKNNVIILNDYDFGGSLAWTCPNCAIFIDGRAPQTMIQKTTFSLLKRYDVVMSELEYPKLKHYNIQYLVLKKSPTTECSGLERALMAECKESSRDSDKNNYVIAKMIDDGSISLCYEDETTQVYSVK